jgi:glyoxylase-like metal-dependent hydrolase (beta-lactamase superfamily II)
MMAELVGSPGGSEVEAGIHRVDTPLGNRFASLWLIQGRDRSVLFDTGVDTAIPQHLMPYLSHAGIPPESIGWVVVSHADVDHFGGVADAHEQLPVAAVVAGRADSGLIADYSRFEAERVRGFRSPWGLDESPEAIAWCRAVARVARVDRAVDGGEVLDLGDRQVEIVAVPGHTHGHLALRDISSGAWFVSDAVLGDAVPLADGTPAFPPTYRYVEEYLRTIELIARAAPPTLTTAHYGTYSGAEVGDFLDVSRDFVDRLERVVLAVVTEAGPSSLTELLPEINRRVATWPVDGTDAALAFPVVGHLERLRDSGRVTVRAETEDSSPGLPAVISPVPDRR